MCTVEVSPAKIEVYAARTTEIPSVKYPAPALAAACIVRSERAGKRLYCALFVPTNPMHFDPGAHKGSENRKCGKVKADCEYELLNGLLFCGFLGDSLF